VPTNVVKRKGGHMPSNNDNLVTGVAFGFTGYYIFKAIGLIKDPEPQEGELITENNSMPPPFGCATNLAASRPDKTTFEGGEDEDEEGGQEAKRARRTESKPADQYRNSSDDCKYLSKKLEIIDPKFAKVFLDACVEGDMNEVCSRLGEELSQSIGPQDARIFVNGCSERIEKLKEEKFRPSLKETCETFYEEMNSYNPGLAKLFLDGCLKKNIKEFCSKVHEEAKVQESPFADTTKKLCDRTSKFLGKFRWGK
jgi:hypothetical protein